MVRSIAERHGGSVTIDDAPIGGARFVVRLPGDGERPEPPS
jgi:signal transduction histidine kinase